MGAMGTQYGAIVHGRRVAADVASSVEARALAEGQLVALVAVQGDLATPSLECVKGAFARVEAVSERAAVTLATAAPPPPYASGVGVVLLLGSVAHVATTGAARCYRERDGVLAALAAGAHEVVPGDTLIAASHASLGVGRRFLTTEVPADRDAAFRNDSLDAALSAALASYPELFAVAAARVR